MLRSPQPLLISLALIPLLAGPVLAQPAAADWYWQNPLPQGGDLTAVWGRSANEVYAIGGQQTLLRWDGVSWTGDYRPVSWPIYDLWGLDTGVLFAVGYGGTVLRYDGVAWATVPTDFNDSLTAILAFSETDIYVAERFPGRTIRHYDGATWTAIGEAPDGIHDLGGTGPTDIYAVGFEGMMTHYDGATWTPVPGFSSVDIASVWSFAPDDVFALQFGSQLYHFDGLDWTLVGTDTSGAYESDMWGTSASNLWFVDRSGGLSHYDGLDVTEYDLPNDGLLGVWGDDQGNVHAVGDYGALLGFDGADWTAHSSAATYNDLNAVWGLSPDDLYAVGSAEIVIHYDGNAWTQIHPTMFSVWFNDVWAAATDDVYAVGKRGVRHYDGAQWMAMDDGLRQLQLAHNAIWGFGPDDIVSVADWGAIVRYDGGAWTVVREASPSQGNLYGVWGAAPDDIWAVGPANAFLHWDGLDWNTVPVSTVGELQAIVGAASDDITVLGAGGELYHYDGNGWTQKNDLVGQSVVAIHGTGGADLVALSSFGYVWETDGNDWYFVDSEARTGLADIWGSSSEGITVVGGGGSVLWGGVPPSDVPDFAVGARLNLRGEPNPFNPVTNLRFTLPDAGHATLAIHDAAGRKIVTLLDRELPSGGHSVRWDGCDAGGRRQASGVYFASVRTAFGREVLKLALVK